MKDALEYLNSLGLHRVKPGLERIVKILKAMGDPQDEAPSIIVAGTNGKGSVAAAVASVLEAQGYKAGLYTSPHLIRVTERIKVNGKEISVEDFARLIMQTGKTAAQAGVEPSYFEAVTAAAFLYFREQKVDFSVLEVGMGGRWDATNIVNPLISAITNISRDHTEFLGYSIKEIALEKAGIIKQRIPIITAAKGDALAAIKTAARQKSAPLSVAGVDFGVTGDGPHDFNYRGREWSLKNLYFNLAGFYQLENASVAVAALETLSHFHDVEIGEPGLRKGLSSVKWEGRMEVLRDNPPLILDGAHNPGAAYALRESLQKMFPGEEFVFLIGMLRDKNHAGFLSEISKIAKYMVITEPPSDRAIKAEELSEIAKRFSDQVNVIKDVEKAFYEVRTLSTPVCIVTGSLYLVGEIKKLIQDARCRIQDR